jgi:hypothetical protein
VEERDNEGIERARRVKYGEERKREKRNGRDKGKWY